MPDQFPPARPRKHLLPNQRAPAKRVEARRSIQRCPLRGIPIELLEPGEPGRPDRCRRTPRGRLGFRPACRAVPGSSAKTASELLLPWTAGKRLALILALGNDCV